MGATTEAMPTPMPPASLEMINKLNEVENAHPIPEYRNRKPASRIVFFRHARSLRKPVTSTPMMHPSKPQLTSHPSMEAVRENCDLMRLTAPEITAVS
jgi:hypothetical protein